MMAFLQVAVETNTFHSVWCSGKCYVQLFGFKNKITQCIGHAVMQLVEALRYKTEGHGFDS
jgi:hypothetical protein